MVNAYCKEHDELEPENHDDILWTCPKCSEESIKGLNLDKVMQQIKEGKIKW